MYDSALVLTFVCLLFTSSPTRSRRGIAVLGDRAKKKNVNNESNKPCSSFSPDLVQAFDIRSILEVLASHCGTKRGYDAIIDLSGLEKEASNLGYNARSPSAKRQIVRHSYGLNTPSARQAFRTSIAQDASETSAMYRLVAQADFVLRDKECLPPLYGSVTSPLSPAEIPDTDHDEWLDEPIESWRHEFVLEAEQIVRMLVKVYDWSLLEEVKTKVPGLARIAVGIKKDCLRDLLHEIQGSVEISRVRTMLDPSARSTYSFCLSRVKFPVLQVLEDRRERLAAVSKSSRNSEEKLSDLMEELKNKDTEILTGLALAIQRHREVIDSGLNLVAKLDVIFAKAAYGIATSGFIPTVKSAGVIDVQGFMHPLLLASRIDAVPVDLRLCHTGRRQALIITGPNGGGKTLTMKAFAVACLLAKIGVPLTCTVGTHPRVDFFCNVLSSVGDLQDASRGQSTYMGHINNYSRLIKCVHEDPQQHHTLVLLDELGTGTEPAAGSAIAQAVLENLLLSSMCRVVATTHSARLKALSFESNNFDCAAVLCKFDDEHDRFDPEYRLQYGVIGESYALGAAKRAEPPLPTEVLHRAIDMMSSTEDPSVANARTLTASLGKQISLFEEKTEKITESEKDCRQIRMAMHALALSYDCHLNRLEQRVNVCYDTLKAEGDAVELLGKTLLELRTVRATIKSECDLLKERGLRAIPPSYTFTAGELVVIVSDELEGVTAKVVDVNQVLLPNQVAVVPAFTPWEDPVLSGPTRTEPVVYERHKLALWDCDEMGDSREWPTTPIVGKTKSNRRLISLLSRIKESDRAAGNPRSAKIDDNDRSATRTGSSFTSSRERKLTSKKLKKSKRRRKRNR